MSKNELNQMDQLQAENAALLAERADAPALLEQDHAAIEIKRLTDLNARQSIDVQVLELAVAVVSRALDEFVGACTDDDGKPRAPDRSAVMRARAMLPPACRHALKKATDTPANSGRGEQ